jgi:hypothetical protein
MIINRAGSWPAHGPQNQPTQRLQVTRWAGLTADPPRLLAPADPRTKSALELEFLNTSWCSEMLLAAELYGSSRDPLPFRTACYRAVPRGNRIMPHLIFDSRLYCPYRRAMGAVPDSWNARPFQENPARPQGAVNTGLAFVAEGAGMLLLERARARSSPMPPPAWRQRWASGRSARGSGPGPRPRRGRARSPPSLFRLSLGLTPSLCR